MKRAGNLYDLVHTYENICLAYVKARKGKQSRQYVVEYAKHLQKNLQALRQQLLEENCSVGNYRFFYVFDPKKRLICAAPFAERVLHHAIMNICEPVLEQSAIHDSYACRRGKGLYAAIERCQKFSRRYHYYLQIDIKHYFDTIDHDTLLELLQRKIKDRRLLDLFGKIFATYSITPGTGLPIGNLISQHCANFYLAVFDHWIKEQRKIPGYIRYMDDCLLFSDSREVLRGELKNLRIYLAETLGLTVKNSVQLHRCSLGIAFLGYVIFPGRILLGKRSRRRFAARLDEYEQQWLAGKWDTPTLVAHVEPLIAFTRQADALGFRQKFFAGRQNMVEQIMERDFTGYDR
ncbi:reverse transcriptase domain-containing protein [Desulfomarina sp.]